MPIKTRQGLPALEKLKEENIFAMTEMRALQQDIRPLQIAILNLMPEKEKTDLQLLRRLSNTPLQIDVSLVSLESHTSKSTPKEYLRNFYTSFSNIRDKNFDGLIITGAPVEKLDFEDVDYWQELKEIMDWSLGHVNSILYLCWASQAGLFHHFGIHKHTLASKQFGIFRHTVNHQNCPLVRGFDDEFWAPHSRHTSLDRDEIAGRDELYILSESPEAGVYIIMSANGKHVFVTGHSEYDPLTLKEEYERDLKKGLDIKRPVNYFPGDDISKEPIVKWRSHSSLLFSNWINYYVYQKTPYDINRISIDSKN